MKTIQVVAAIIQRDNQVLATQRGYGDLKNGWEFPGGKIESGETEEQALKREIKEELNMQIEVGELFDVVEYDYPKFHLTMQCFLCKAISGEMVLNEHQSARWLDKTNIDSVEWLPADIELIAKLKRRL